MEHLSARDRREYFEPHHPDDVHGCLSASERFDALWENHADEMARGLYRPFSDACRADPELEGELIRRWMAGLSVHS